jgi:hypothetical protein
MTSMLSQCHVRVTNKANLLLQNSAKKVYQNGYLILKVYFVLDQIN